MFSISDNIEFIKWKIEHCDVIYLSGGRLMFEFNKNSINAIYFNNVTETTFNAGITSFSVGSRILNYNDNQCYAGGAFFFNPTNGNCNVYA